LSVIGALVLVRRDIIEQAVQPAGVVPVDPLRRGVLDVVDGFQRASQERAVTAYGFGLVQPDRGLGQSVIPRRQLRSIPSVISELYDKCARLALAVSRGGRRPASPTPT
jgi:hypothetical protein